MYFYLRGKINNIISDKIIIEVNNIGYGVFVSHPDQYHIGELRQVFLYEHIHEDERYLVGFDNLEEKKLFLELISVNGLGPKTALNILRNAEIEQIYNAILSNNVTFLRKLPNIGTKCAEQIILDLKGKITGKKGNPHLYSEVQAVLKEMGYKRKAIEEVLSEINEPNASSEDIIKIALTMLGK